MSGKSAKKLRKELNAQINDAATDMYNAIVAGVNRLPVKHRIKIALRIIRGRW